MWELANRFSLSFVFTFCRLFTPKDVVCLVSQDIVPPSLDPYRFVAQENDAVLPVLSYGLMSP